MRPASLALLCLLPLAATAASSNRPSLIVQSAHETDPRYFATSPDGRVLASLAPGTLKLWDIASGLLLRDVRIPACEYVQRLRFVGKGELLAAGGFCPGPKSSFDVVIEVATGKTVGSYAAVPEHHGELEWRGGYTPDGEQQIMPVESSAPSGESLMLWNVRTGKLIRELKTKVEWTERVSVLSASVVGLCKDDHWRFVSVATSAQAFPPYEGNCRSSFALSPDEKLLALSTNDAVELRSRTAKVATIAQVAAIELEFSADGKRLSLAGRDWVAVYDAGSFEKQSYRGIGVDTFPALVDGGAAVVHLNKQSIITLWQVSTGALLRELAGTVPEITQVGFSPDGRFLAMTPGVYGTPCTIKLWDLGTARIVRTVTGDPSTICTFAFTPDGKQIAWVSRPWVTAPHVGGISFFDLATGVATRVQADQQVDAFAFSGDGKWLATSKRTEKQPLDSTTLLFERATGKQVATFPGNRVRFSSDSSEVFIADDLGEQKAQIVNTGTWQRVGKIFQGGPSQVNADLSMIAYETAWGPASFKGLGLLHRGQTEMFFTTGGWLAVHQSALSPDGSRFAAGGTKGGALFDTKTQKQIRALDPEHPLELLTLAYSKDGKWLATGGQEGTVVLRDGLTGEPIATLLAAGETESVVWLPSGEYIATKGALRKVAFRVGAHAYPFEQFDLKFNRPDLVMKTLGHASGRLVEAAQRARQKRLLRMGFTEEMLGDEFHLPEAEIARAGVPESTPESTVTLAITARDSQVPLDRLLVTVNDSPFDGRVSGIDLREQKSKVLARKIEVPLLAGRNRIQVSVLNAQGAESLRDTIEVRGAMQAKPGKLYALTVGISQYKTAEYNLRYAAKDARDLGALLSAAPHFSSEQTIAVLDQDATREGILEAKKALLQAGPNDEVIVFLAGHGLLDDKLDYYFATTDIDFEHPALRGLSYGDLEGLLDGVKARRKLLLMDTCNSGELDKGEVEAGAAVVAKADPRVQVRSVGTRGIKKKVSLGQDDLSALLGDLFADTRRGSGAVAISSAGGAEFALESDEWKNGVFTFALLDGLKSGAADRDHDGVVTASELRDLVQTRVRELTQGRQSPTSRRENLAVDFAVY
jgi:WD40 repeat protein